MALEPSLVQIAFFIPLNSAWSRVFRDGYREHVLSPYPVIHRFSNVISDDIENGTH